MSWTDILDNTTFETASTLTNDGFFPDIDVVQFCTAYRIPAEIPPETVSDALLSAMLRTNRTLNDLKIRYQAEGYATLVGVPATQINGQSVNQFHYIKAVFCEGKASLLPECLTVDRTEDAENVAKTSSQTIRQYEKTAGESIRALLGRPAYEVSLI